MRTIIGTAAILGVLLVGPAARPVPGKGPGGVGVRGGEPPIPTPPGADIPSEALTGVVRRVCATCHNDEQKLGNLSLATFDVLAAPQTPDIAEKIIVKLRAGMMPPPGAPHPGGDTLTALVETLENIMDEAAAAAPNPGARPFQRLNRAEYAASVKDLLGLVIDAGSFLPLDTKSANFDNIADVQLPSPTLVTAYLNAATEISRLTLGNPSATASEATYAVPRTASQTAHVDGAPYGTRGGVSVIHNFPADGMYSFRVSFYHETTGGLVGGTARDEQVDISVDGERVALFDVDRFMSTSDPNQATQYTGRVPLKAGQHRVSAAFVPPSFQEIVVDLISPPDWSLASTASDNTYGLSTLPHMRDFVILGPTDPTGVSDTPVRQRIFSCRPTAAVAARPCAEQIVSRLATRAYRRPLEGSDLRDLMSFFDAAYGEGGFEGGVRAALEAILASPDFVFRLERVPDSVMPGRAFALDDLALASRLSFFLWSAPPDDELIQLAQQGKLTDQLVLDQQVIRMLADRRATALSTRFAAQWFRLDDLDKIFPDVRQYPDFDEQLRASLRQETELFFANLVREDRDVLDIFSADYTFVNERLARHYGIPGVVGGQFRRVEYPDDTRRGLLGHGSVLLLTSMGNRTSPVLRGKWVMEVLMGTPPPPPPPNVPAFEASPDAGGGRRLTTRERMEAHSAAPVCASCHNFIDPIGLALDHFDATGKVRIRENMAPLDTRGTFYDGTPISNPSELVAALLKRPIPLVRNFTENLLSYAIGRPTEYFDQPTVRAVVGAAEANDYKMSSLVMGIVESDVFQKSQLQTTAN